jgi:16S rRNA (uracil1498-N3)-methyltransferase
MHNLFYIAKHQINGDVAAIEKKELHHIKHVLRIKHDDIIYLTDGCGNQYKTVVTDIKKAQIITRIMEKTYIEKTNKVDLELAFVPLKGSRNDTVIEKSTEIGISGFRPFISRYSVVRQLTRQKVDRFKRVALSAMLQSRQFHVPDFFVFKNLAALLKNSEDFDMILLADPKGDIEVPDKGRKILYIVGPEGGFDDRELKSCQGQGARLLSLGSSRLRSETAVIVGISKILAAYGQI